MKDHREHAHRVLTVRSELQHEIKHGTLSRSDMYKKLLLTGGAFALISQFKGVGQAWADMAYAIAPQTTPFTETLVHVNRDAYIKVATRLTPGPTETANVGAGGIGESRREPHQGRHKDSCVNE